MLRELKEVDEKGDYLLEEVQKYTLGVKELTLVVLNHWNRELNCLVV